MKSPSIFLSHSSHDKAEVKQLAYSLMMHGLYVWYDDFEIQVGQDIVERIYDGIRDSDYFGIVLTKHSANSRWVKEELNYARIREIESQKTVVLPLLFEGVDIPPALRNKKYANFTDNYEHGLADLLRVFDIETTRSRSFLQVAAAFESLHTNEEDAEPERGIGFKAANSLDRNSVDGSKDGLIGHIHGLYENSRNMVFHDYRVLSEHGPNRERHEGALWRDLACMQCWQIAYEVVSRDALDRHSEASKNNSGKLERTIRLRILNEIGPNLSRLSEKSLNDVVSTIKEVRVALSRLAG